MPLDHKRHQIRQLARYTLPCSGLSPRWRGSSVFCRLRWPCSHADAAGCRISFNHNWKTSGPTG